MIPERYFEGLTRDEHFRALDGVFNRIQSKNVYMIADLGSGKTSLSSLLYFFNKAKVDAIIHPTDDRKFNSIVENVKSLRYTIRKLDICKEIPPVKYDLVLAHLILGEAVSFGNSSELMINNIFKFNCKNFIIFDYLEDSGVNFDYLERYVKDNNYKILGKDQVVRKNTFMFSDFEGKTFVMYYIQK